MDWAAFVDQERLMTRRRLGHRRIVGTCIDAVRDRADRLLRIFERPDGNAAEQAAKIVADGVRLNLDPVWLAHSPLSTPERERDDEHCRGGTGPLFKRAAMCCRRVGAGPVSGALPTRLTIRALVVACVVAPVAAQQPTIRTSTDLFRVEVDVVDRQGSPITGLTPDQFDVEIGGRRHEVRFADLVLFRPNGPVTSGSSAASAVPAAASAPPTAAPPHRLFMLAIDAQTFRPEALRGLAVTAQRFVGTLRPDDLVGLYTYPLGPKVEPTIDHAAVIGSLDAVSGQKPPTGECNIRSADLVDWYPSTPQEKTAIARRYACPGVFFPVEIETRIGLLEAQAQANLGSLRELINGLSTVPGRKVLVLITAGLPTTDRPGGRPDIGSLPIALGEAAARANVSLHTLFVDNSVLSAFSAEERQGRTGASLARDADLAERSIDLFTGAAGGTFAKVLTGSGEQAFDRLTRETSAYYLLGIDVAAQDRTGRPLRMTVKLRQKDATIRYRPLVIVPAMP
jgi:VWFA-related protein